MRPQKCKNAPTHQDLVVGVCFLDSCIVHSSPSSPSIEISNSQLELHYPLIEYTDSEDEDSKTSKYDGNRD